MKGILLRSFTIRECIILDFSLIGIVLALTTLVVVRRVMNGFHEEFVAKIGNENASIIAEALKIEQNLMFLMLVLIALAAALSILAGLSVMWRERSRRTGS
jgi:ABC-type lipoprotein release transport system permease subunit